MSRRACICHIRPASPADAPFLAHCRRSMFRDMDVADEATEEMEAAFCRYAVAALSDGRYVAWIAQADEKPIGGLGAFLVTGGPPFSGNPGGSTARLMNMYVEAEWRRQGIARRLLRHAVTDLARLGLGSVALVAGEQGRRLYGSEGFEPVPEMRRRLTPAGADVCESE